MAKQKSAPAETEVEQPSGGYTVLARRYRPQTFAEIVGQEAVARVLANAINGNRVAHAYLFTGARGVGKTSTARILAKALNCEKGPTDTPCGTCAICQGIASGDDVDVLEIDGASTRGIDDVREIRGSVQYRPSRARFKIYIIDEVHMLTREAFNALLKTLEEPPAHVKFIFATTDAQKVPVTILSRCQRFDFPSISTDQIVERLHEIAIQEKMPADREALQLIARRAGGSMRDAQSLLDQLLSCGGDQLTTDQVHRLLGSAPDDRIVALAEAILNQQPAAALALLDEAARGGLLLSELIEQLIAYWRDLMVLSCAGSEAPDLSLPVRFRANMVHQAKEIGLDALLAGLDVLAGTRERLRGCNHARTLVEMALVRLGRLQNLISLAQLAKMLNQPGSVIIAPTAGSEKLPGRPIPAESEKKKPLIASNGEQAGEQSVELNAATLEAVWAETLQNVGVLLGSELSKAGIPAIFAPNTLAIRFPPGYNQARDHCQRPPSVTRIQQALRKLTGSDWVLRVEEMAASVPSLAAPAEPAEEPKLVQKPRPLAKEEAGKEPLVQRALDVLNAQMVRVDDGFGVNKVLDLEGPEETLSEEEL